MNGQRDKKGGQEAWGRTRRRHPGPQTRVYLAAVVAAVAWNSYFTRGLISPRRN